MKTSQNNKVYITDYIKDPYIEKNILGDLLQDYINDEVGYLMVWHEKIDENFINQFPNLKGIVRYGVGFDKIDLKICKEKNICFCNTPDYGTEEVSNTAVCMIMDSSRKVFEYNQLAKNIKNSTWQENTISRIRRNNKIKVGIIGAGRIGSSVILKLNSLNFKTYFYDPYVNWGYEKILNTTRIYNLENLLNDCDIITLHCPLNESTKGMINKHFLNSMKRGSSLVNTARGELICDLNLLFDYIENEEIYSVYLDVLPDEPPKKSKLIQHWRSNSKLSPRIIINPHTAYYSKDSFEEMRTKAAQNILRMINNEPLLYRII